MKAKRSSRFARSFSTRFVPLAGAIVAVTWIVGSVPARVARAQDREVTAELSEEQQEIKAVLQDVGGRMRSLAKKLEEAQPDDAKRLREAADKIHSSDLNRVLDDVASLLRKANFLEALGRQDKALEELDTIIGILERTKFEGREETERKLNEIEKSRLEVSKLAGKQESLLQKTKEFLDQLKAMTGLKDLKSDLASLKDKQAAINQGGDPEKLDPGAAEADQKALEQAKDLAAKLREAQEKVNQRMAGLPGQNLPIPELRELVSRLDDLIQQSKDLAQKGDEASAAEKDLKELTSGKPPSGAPEKLASEKSGANKSGANKSGANKSGANKGSTEKNGNEKNSTEKNGNDNGAGEKGASEKGSPETTSPDKSASEKSASEKTASGKPSPEKSGPSDVEMARRAEAIKEARAKLDAAAKDLAAKVGKLSDDVSKSPTAGAEAKESAAHASEKATDASKGLEKGDLARAAEKERQAASDLQKARDQLAGDLQKMEEANTSQTAAVVQEQGLLEKESRDGAAQMGKDSQQSSSEASRSALEKGSKSLSDAAQSMEKAARAQQDGDRSGAKSAGEKAKADLARAEAELSKGQQAAAQRTAAEKAADLQKKLAKKAEEARKKSEELRKKLQKKESGASSQLGEAEKALSEASSAMRDAAEAGKKGDSSLQKKKGEEAMERLEKAAASVEQEEKDELARLEKEKLKQNAKEQDELARLTKEQAKKSSSASKGSGDQSQQLEQASESMDKAGEELEKEEAEKAEKNQEEALAKLKDSEEELRKEEERLAQLKREQEMLSMVEALTGVKDGQEKINSETISVDAGREKDESRRQKIKVQQKVEKLVAREGELADEVDGLNQKLKDELARVFTFVLKNSSNDMRQIRDSLKELETGTYTQFLEKEVVRDLERLIAALKAELEKPPEQQPGPKQQQQNEARRRLVPPVAELRMLKEMQLDVNKGTRDLEDLRKASTGQATESWEKALNRLMQKQGSVSRMTQELIKDFQKFAGEEGDEEKGDSHEDGPEKPEHEQK